MPNPIIIRFPLPPYLIVSAKSGTKMNLGADAPACGARSRIFRSSFHATNFLILHRSATVGVRTVPARCPGVSH